MTSMRKTDRKCVVRGKLSLSPRDKERRCGMWFDIKDGKRVEEKESLRLIYRPLKCAMQLSTAAWTEEDQCESCRVRPHGVVREKKTVPTPSTWLDASSHFALREASWHGPFFRILASRFLPQNLE